MERHNTENSKQIFPEKELRCLSPNFHIHVSVSELYIPTIDLPILLQDRSWEYINRSQTHEWGNWDWGRAISRNGIHKWDFCCSARIEHVLVWKIEHILYSTASIGYVSSINPISQTAHKNWSKCSCAGNMFLGQREGRILASTCQKTAFSGDVISF